MAIEETLVRIAVALETLVAASQAGGSAAASVSAEKPAGKAATGKAATGKTTKVEPEVKQLPKNSEEELAALAAKLKEAKGAAPVKALIKSVGGVDKLAEVPAENRDALCDAIESALAEGAAGDDDI